MTSEHKESINFIEEIIEKDLAEGKNDGRLHTRFPPEPNGYLHIGHAKSICLNFGLAQKYNGKCNLRFDDTNPETEETDYVNSIKKDIEWLGFKWDNELYASDYFDTLYMYATQLIQKGLAYVDDSTSTEIAALKGTPTSPGTNSPYRERTIEENIDLFSRMKAGEFADGAKVLRAKIDMAHTNMLMRDPVIYRIKHAHHHRTGDKWCIYPMYDFAHGQSDSIEKITHSICTLEFVPHRELYDWFIEKLEIFPSHQYEFARGNVNYMVTSKRKLLELVRGNYVTGWDDPRMPTISGHRRRGYTPESIREFWDKVGIQKRDNSIDISLLEFCLRDHLNKIALRRMAVLDPIKLVITNYDKGNEILSAENNPEDENGGHRDLSFSNELWIERDDFMETPPNKYFRLGPGLSVRLKHAYIVKCERFEKDENERIENFIEKRPVDMQILQDKDPYYRVLDLTKDVYNDASGAALHKMIGGYHPAKMEIYQDLIDRHLSKGFNSEVLNMLNAKYFIVPQGNQAAVMPNPSANGPCWFVSNIKVVPDAESVMSAMNAPILGDTAKVNNSFNSKTTAVAQQKNWDASIPVTYNVDSSSRISLIQYGLNTMKYESNNAQNGFAVFSDIYYDKGWKAFVDDKEVKISRVNYVLRGIPINAGKHKIEFTFKPESFLSNNKYAFIASIILIGILSVLFWRGIKE